MRIRIAAAAVAAAALLSLTACSSDDKDSGTGSPSTTPATTAPPTASPSPSGTPGDSTGGAGLPGAPDAATQDLVVSSLKKIDPALADDPDRTIDSARTQCRTLSGNGDRSGHEAAQRFGSPGHPLTDAQGTAINAALSALLCEPSL
ncbi:hypothetical protein [Streptomyces sp. NPDC020983]|uniref:hypothetical protein n=1 Tax=Streptomyces sp. NPDC020983 TaxID=3365106 RepID=UPI00378C8913